MNKRIKLTEKSIVYDWDSETDEDLPNDLLIHVSSSQRDILKQQILENQKIVDEVLKQAQPTEDGFLVSHTKEYVKMHTQYQVNLCALVLIATGKDIEEIK